MTSKTRILLYGSNGYTGRLAAQLAANRKLDVVLGGRNKEALAEIGEPLQLPIRVSGLEDPKQLSDALDDIACVVHMAGPFASTSRPMLDACLTTQTDYVDVTGEIEVFESLWSRTDEIRRAGITAIPGAGFDVVPSDCLAAYVASKSSQPTSLLIALRGLENASQGTLRTAIRQVSKPVLCRRDGAIVALADRSPHAIDFGSGVEPCVPVSWGDVATAFHSTGIGNITAYFRRTSLFLAAGILQEFAGTLLQSHIVQRGLEAIVRSLPAGPSKDQRLTHQASIVAEVIEASGKSHKAMLTTPDAYDFAANSALEIAARINMLAVPLGLVTPSQAFGADFVLSLPGCTRMDIPSAPMPAPARWS